MGKQIESRYELGMLDHYVGNYLAEIVFLLSHGKSDEARKQGSELIETLRKLEPQTILIKAVTSAAEKVDWADADSFDRFREEYKILRDDARRDERKSI